MNTNELKNIIEAAEIGEIRLVDLEAKLGGFGVRDAKTQHLVNLSHSSNVASPLSENGEFTILASLRCQIIAEESKDALFTLRADFELSYRLKGGLKSTSEDVQSFAEVNGIFNAWPFFREIVHATMARMMLRPITLPLYRHGKISPETSKVRGTQSEEN